MTTTNTADGSAALVPPKKPKSHRTEFADAHRACRTEAEREQLALVIRARWKEAELSEYARLYFFKNGRDYPTAMSYRRAIADLAAHYRGLNYPDAKPSDYPHAWLIQFRKGGSQILPPRREGLLQRGRGLNHRVSDDEYAWPGHTEEFRSMIEQRCRDYFKTIPPDQPVHVNAWAAAKQAYDREQYPLALKAMRETEARTLYLSPKRKNAPEDEPSSFDYCCWEGSGPQGQGPFKLCGPLKPHFNRDFEGHSDAFREEVAVWARKDNHLKPNAHVSPRRWKAACYKHYVLIERIPA